MAAISAVEVPKARLERSLVERPAGRGAVFSLDSSQSCCWDWLEDDEWEESAMVDCLLVGGCCGRWSISIQMLNARLQLTLFNCMIEPPFSLSMVC